MEVMTPAGPFQDATVSFTIIYNIYYRCLSKALYIFNMFYAIQYHRDSHEVFSTKIFTLQTGHGLKKLMNY